jgi:hypothetical protein
MFTPSLEDPRTLDLLREREEWRMKKDRFLSLKLHACREEEDDNLAWLEREYEYALAQYRATCRALDVVVEPDLASAMVAEPTPIAREGAA